MWRDLLDGIHLFTLLIQFCYLFELVERYLKLVHAKASLDTWLKELDKHTIGCSLLPPSLVVCKCEGQLPRARPGGCAGTLRNSFMQKPTDGVKGKGKETSRLHYICTW